MVKWAIKKYLIGKINKLLDAYQDNVSKTRETLKVWIARLDKILAAFRSLLEKLEDNVLTAEEADETVAEIENVVKEW